MKRIRPIAVAVAVLMTMVMALALGCSKGKTGGAVTPDEAKSKMQEQMKKMQEFKGGK